MATQTVSMFLRLRNLKDSQHHQCEGKSFTFSNENFPFSRVFPMESTQDELFDSIGKPLIENIAKGNNGLLLACGATGSGKSYSLIGESGQEGLILKIFEDLFIRANLLKLKKTIGIVISYFEIEGEKVRDLIKMHEGKQCDNIDIREYQGHVYMDNLSVINIENFDEIIRLLQEVRKQRKASIQQFGFTSYVHNLLKITFSQKELNMNKAGTLTIVELADNDSGKEVINKSLETLKNLVVDLQQNHHASSDENLLTKVLANSFKSNCLTSLLFTINTSQERQTLNTLRFSHSCYLNTAANSAEKVLFKSHQQADRIKKLQDEIKDLKHKIDKTQELHESKLRSFGDIIGFNLDIDTIINAFPGSKERKTIENHLNSIEALDEVENRNRRLEQKLLKNNRLFEEIHKFELKIRDKNTKHIRSLEDQIKEVKLQIIELNEKIQEDVKKKMSAKTDDLHRVLLSNHMEIEEKAAVIHNLPLTLQSIASDMRAIVDYKEMGKAGLDFELSKQYQNYEESHSKNLSKIKADTDHNLKNLDSEIRRFENECNLYIREKIEYVSKIENELIGCYNIYLEQNRLIKDIESGVFNNGIKPIYLTVHDYPKKLQREKYPNLFKALKRNGILTSSKDNNFIKISNNLFTKKYVSSTKKSFNPEKSNFRVTFPPPTKPEKIIVIDDEETSEKTILLRKEVNELQKCILEQSKTLKNSRNSFNHLEIRAQEVESEMKKILADREKHKEIYNNLIKTKFDSKIVIESQKRLMDKYIFITEQVNSRPATGKSRPMTGKSRPFTANGLRLAQPKTSHIVP